MTVIILPPKSERPICAVPGCGRTAQPSGKRGEIRWRRPKWMKEQFPESEGYACNKHHSIKHGMGGWEYKIHRKTYCENRDGSILGEHRKCTTTIWDPEWQLDADHINGDPSDNRPENIQTLCKTCHPIKTKESQDYMSAGRKTLGVH